MKNEVINEFSFQEAEEVKPLIPCSLRDWETAARNVNEHMFGLLFEMLAKK